MSGQKSGVTLTKSLALNQEKRGAVIGVKGYLLGKIFRIQHNQILNIGRDPAQCDVIIKGERISRMHCSIRYNALKDEYILRDCSTNGVVVDRKYKVKSNVDIRIRPGSILWIGNGENEIRLR
jgi:predicted component of type VI protein secretion system